MTGEHKYKAMAKALVGVSKENGLVSEARVRATLDTLVQQKPDGLRQILHAYLFYIKREIQNSRVLVEHTGGISTESLEAIRSQLTTEYGRPLQVAESVNPDLIGGVKIHVGDDVIDNSVAGRLKALESSIL